MEKDDPNLLHAVKLARNILITSGRKLMPNTAASVNNFLRAAGNGPKRKKLTERDLIRIVNIAKNIRK